MKTKTNVLLRLALCAPAAVVGFLALLGGKDSYFLKKVASTLHTTNETPMQIAVLGMYALLLMGVCAFAFYPLWRKKRPKNDGITRAANLVIAVSVSGALLYLPSQSMAGQQVSAKTVAVSVEKQGKVVALDDGVSLTTEEQQAVDAAVNSVLATFPKGFTQNQNGSYEIGINMTILACVIVVVVIVLVIAGAVYIYYKVKKWCSNINDNIKKKQTDPDDSTNSANRSVMFKLQSNGAESVATEYAAFLYPNPPTNYPSDLPTQTNCSGPNVVLSYSISQTLLADGAGSIPIMVSRPTKIVDEDEYLIRHGLGTNYSQNSWSVNRQSTNAAPPQIALNGDTLTVNPWGTNAMVTVYVQGTTNLINWETLPFSRLSVPLLTGTNVVHVIVEDAVTSFCVPYKFYRLRIVQ